MTNRHLTHEDDVRRLPLHGSRLMQVCSSPTYVDLFLGSEDAEVAQVRVESSGTVVRDDTSTTHEAGPGLASELLALLDLAVVAVDARGLDLALTFEGNRLVIFHVDSTGYESYTVTVGGDLWAAVG